MRVLMLSTDRTILDPASAAGKRLAGYQTFADIKVLLVRGGFFRAFRDGNEMLKTFKPDIVSAQDPFFTGLIGFLLARRARAALQIQIHTDFANRAFIFESPKHFVYYLVALFVIPRAACLRVVSERIARAARRMTKAPVSVLPIRVFAPAAAPAPRPAEFGKRPAVITVSRLTPEKRVHFVIDAMKHLPEAQLFVIGEGPLRKSLEIRVERLGLGERVKFLGYKTDLMPYYMHAAAFAAVSRYEGYGMALMEAALHRLPIVTTDVGVIGDILRDGQEVLVVRADSRSVADALERLLHDVVLARSLGARACERALSRILSEERYLASYQEAMHTCSYKP